MFMTFLLIGVVLLMVEAAIPGFGIFGVTGHFGGKGPLHGQRYDPHGHDEQDSPH